MYHETNTIIATPYSSAVPLSWVQFRLRAMALVVLNLGLFFHRHRSRGNLDFIKNETICYADMASIYKFTLCLKFQEKKTPENGAI